MNYSNNNLHSEVPKLINMLKELHKQNMRIASMEDYLQILLSQVDSIIQQGVDCKIGARRKLRMADRLKIASQQKPTNNELSPLSGSDTEVEGNPPSPTPPTSQ